MNMDTELEVRRREWQSDSAVTPDLRRRVERQRFINLSIRRCRQRLAAIRFGAGSCVNRILLRLDPSTRA